MSPYRNLLPSILVALSLILPPLASQAQIIQLPDCNLNPSHPYCDCRFNPGPWCEEPERKHDPIVLIPGITVSQNKQLLYKDEEGGKWKFAFGFNVYKGLIEKLETAGYEEGEDLLIAHYDWRRPATHNATNYLKPIIDQAKQNTGASKVDVVAHSFGGIVTRAYIQSDDYANDIDQLITLGSPHEGAADAYVAWEGGIFPEGWGFWITQKVKKVERALKETHNQPDIRQPESFRTFFPSLKDMLPVNNFANKDGSPVAVTDLTEQNSWLQNLRNTISDIANKGVNLATIAGTNIQTLDKINLTNDRDPEDEKLNRWRDGKPVTIPPPLDSTAGDARVLLTNAHIGEENITINDAVHHKLPDEAQNQVFELLGLEQEPSFFSDFPEKIFGIIILSPLEAIIEGPNGQILSYDQNDFGDENAEYDDDPNDPDDPKDITILDPPDGQYTVTYTGTGEGEYTIITTYADEDETISSTREGNTESGKTETETITISNNTISLIDDTDYKSLLKEISSLAKQAKKDKLIKGYDQANLTRPVTHATNDLRVYEQRLKKDRTSAAYSRLRDYYQELDEIEKVARQLSKKANCQDLADEILQLVERIRAYSPPLP